MNIEELILELEEFKNEYGNCKVALEDSFENNLTLEIGYEFAMGDFKSKKDICTIKVMGEN